MIKQSSATLFALLLLGMPAMTSPALADGHLSGMVGVNDYDRIFEIAAAYGPLERRSDEDGRWFRGEIDSVVYTISFLNCDDANNNCTSLQFRAWWESNGAHTLEAVNQWNIDRRFSAAYLDARGNATIEWDVNLAGGITAVNFDDNMQWWDVVLRQFEEMVIQPGYDAAGSSSGGGGTASK